MLLFEVNVIIQAGLRFFLSKLLCSLILFLFQPFCRSRNRWLYRLWNMSGSLSDECTQHEWWRLGSCQWRPVHRLWPLCYHLPHGSTETRFQIRGGISHTACNHGRANDVDGSKKGTVMMWGNLKHRLFFKLFRRCWCHQIVSFWKTYCVRVSVWLMLWICETWKAWLSPWSTPQIKRFRFFDREECMSQYINSGSTSNFALPVWI